MEDTPPGTANWVGWTSVKGGGEGVLPIPRLKLARLGPSSEAFDANVR